MDHTFYPVIGLEIDLSDNYLAYNSFYNYYTVYSITSKIDVKIWDGERDYSLWRQKIKAFMLQVKCANAIDESWPENLSVDRKTE